MLMAWLTSGWSLPAFPAEEPTGSPVLPQVQLAPIRLRPSFGGNVDYTMQRNTIGTSKSTSQVLTVEVNAGVDINSFIWQPWLAQVSGGLGFSTYMTDTGYNSGAGAMSNKSASSVVRGKAALDVVPLSRFPFRAHYEKSDNRQDTGFGSANSASQTTRFGLNQRYRTLSGQTDYSASYDQSRWESARSGVDKQRLAILNMRTTLSPNQGLTISGNSDFTEHLGNNQSTLNNTLVAHHNYRPGAALNVENMANLGRTNHRFVEGDNEDKYIQMSSFASWFSNERPLTVTGSARVSGLSNSTPTTRVRQSSANMNLGANYQLSQQVRTYGNAGVNLYDDQDNGTQNVTSNQSVGADYRSDMTDLGTFRYSTHASGSLSNSTASTGSTQSLGLSAGHGLTRSNAWSGTTRLDTNVDQTISTNKSTRNPPSSLLSHSGSLAWTIAGEGGTTGLRLNASDSRTVSGPRNFFQLANLQATRTENMTRNTSLGGDLTIQAVRQGIGDAPRAPTSITSSASLNYAHQRVFGVPRLSFNSEVRIYGNSVLPLATGQPGQESRSWINRLNYSIGRLQLSMYASVSESNHVNQSSLMFRLSRAF